MARRRATARRPNDDAKELHDAIKELLWRLGALLNHVSELNDRAADDPAANLNVNDCREAIELLQLLDFVSSDLWVLEVEYLRARTGARTADLARFTVTNQSRESLLSPTTVDLAGPSERPRALHLDHPMATTTLNERLGLVRQPGRGGETRRAAELAGRLAAVVRWKVAYVAYERAIVTAMRDSERQSRAVIYRSAVANLRRHLRSPK